MQPRSALFDQTIAGSHTLLVRADILSGGRVVATGLPVSGGSVAGNRTQFGRRTCTVVIGDPAYKATGSPQTVTTEVYQPAAGTPSPFGTTPFGSGPFGGGTLAQWVEVTSTIPADLLTPFGNEIRLWRGAITPTGPELIPVGTFGIRSVDFDSGGAFAGITVTGIDRCKLLAETRFPFPRNTILNMSAIGQIRDLIHEVFPFVEVRVDPAVVDVPVPAVTWQQRDAALVDLCASLGVEMFCDPMGAFIVQQIPSPTDPPVDTVIAGPGGVLVSARRSLSRDGVYNGIVARGQSTGTGTAPTSQLVVDSNPTSPTYWYGKFGQIVGFYDSSLLVDEAQCNNAALAMLQNNIGAPRSLDYSTAVNPAREPGDVVALVDPDTGVTEQHLIDSLTIPLDAGGVMTAQTRSTLAVAAHPRRSRAQIYSGSLS